MAVNNEQASISSTFTPGLSLIKCQYSWPIYNFSYYQEKSNDRLLSPIFSMGENDKYKWQLQADLNGHTVEDIGYLSVFLRFVPCKEKEVRAKVEIYIRVEEGYTTECRSTSVQKFNKTSPLLGHSKLIERKDLLSCVSPLDDTLTIVCDITVVESTVNTEVMRYPDSFKVPECRLLDDIHNLFESSELCDVTLISCGQKFPAHKVILAARSAVFSAMFKHDMKEQQQNRVDITDMDDEVLKEMLRFIYTGEADNLDKVATDLLPAADKYQLERLKYLCEMELCESLATENAACRLIIGDLYNAVYLKDQAIKFICKHTKEVLASSSYNSMHKTHPHLIDEAFLIAATKTIDFNL